MLIPRLGLPTDIRLAMDLGVRQRRFIGNVADLRLVFFLAEDDAVNETIGFGVLLGFLTRLFFDVFKTDESKLIVTFSLLSRVACKALDWVRCD